MTTLNETLKIWREGIFRSLRVSAPGYIQSYDSDTGLADIQLTVKMEIEEEFIDPPLMLGVPIRQNNSQAVLFYAPPAENDLVDVVFTDYSISENQQEDGLTIVEPANSEQHDLNNTYAVLRVQTLKNKHRIDDPTLPGVYLADDSKLFLGRLGGGGEEVLNLIHQTATALSDLTDYIKNTMQLLDSNGDTSGPPTNANLLTPVENQLTEIKTGLENLGNIS